MELPKVVPCYQFRVTQYDRIILHRKLYRKSLTFTEEAEIIRKLTTVTQVLAEDAKGAIEITSDYLHSAITNVEMQMADGSWKPLLYFEASDFELVLYNSGIVKYRCQG